MSLLSLLELGRLSFPALDIGASDSQDWDYTVNLPGPPAHRSPQSREPVPQNKAFCVSIYPLGSASLENPGEIHQPRKRFLAQVF